MNDYSVDELLAILLSRFIRDGDVASPAAAYSPVPFAALKLAQLTHAPNLGFILSATGFVLDFLDTKGVPLYKTSLDARYFNASQCIVDFPQIFMFKRDFMILGGLQIDRYGNVNLIGVGDYNNLKFRAPGTAGLATASAYMGRLYYYFRNHDKRTFVEKVDFISAVGYRDGRKSRENLKLLSSGPETVVTPLGVFDFNEQGTMRIKSVNPSHSVEEIIDNTGFELDIPQKIEPTNPPSEAELKILREKVDLEGIL